MKFEWNDNKNLINQEKDGVSFEEAIEVFDDVLQISRLDYRFNYIAYQALINNLLREYMQKEGLGT